MTHPRKRRERKKKKVAPEATVAHVTDPRLEELEMELQKHNQILDEIEKLLDSNLANVDPTKYAELVAQRDRLLAERDELMTAIETIKGENDTLVDKVVSTEAAAVVAEVGAAVVSTAAAAIVVAKVGAAVVSTTAAAVVVAEVGATVV